MEAESAAERGRRVVEARLRASSQSNPMGRSHEILTPVTAPVTTGSVTNWTVVSLKSEVETLHCINAAKEKELLLLKHQLVESNRLIRESRDEKSRMQNGPQSTESATDPPTRKPVLTSSRRGDHLLLQSFSEATAVTLNHVLGTVERTLHVKDIHQLPKAVERLVAVDGKYTELVKAVSCMLKISVADANHGQLVRLLLGIPRRDGSPGRVRDEIKTKAGIAWTFQP